MAVLTLLLTFAAMPPVRGCEPQFAPLEAASSPDDSALPVWSKHEAGEWDGAGWLGWTPGSDGDDILKPVRLIVRDRPKRRRDDEAEVTVESIPAVTYAVRCIPGLRAGKINTASSREPTAGTGELIDGAPLRISLGKRRYQVRLQSARADLSDAEVLLSEGRRTQVLYAAHGFADDPHFYIEWAGDLDRDGGLDLIVDLSRKYSLHPYRLLLSSKASGTHLVGDAAVFVTMSR